MFSSVLSPEQILKLHEASIRILETTGVHVPHEDMRKRLAAAGATVDETTEIVRIPGSLVDDCLASCGKTFAIYGRDESKVARFGFGERNYNSIAGEAHWVDTPGGSRRFAVLEDVATAARFGDALPHINIPGAMTDPHDVPTPVKCIEVFAAMLRNTTKPVTFWLHDRASAFYLNELMIAIRGSEQAATEKPIFYPFLEPISPLRFPFNGIDLLYETARLNLPVPIGPMAQTGLSAPCTLAGTMAQENAEILAGLVITQMVRPGMPVCYGGICHAFDMRTTQLIFSGPEQAIFGVALTQMGKHYGLPVYINVGLTDSKRPDAQAGLEAGITLALGAAAGADIFGHMGISGVDQATSLDILMLQDEIISYVESSMRQLDFTDEAFGFDVIDEVGPGGSFINTMHTVENFRKELWVPRILDREFYQAWEDAGARTTETRCSDAVREILANHEPTPLPDDQSHAIDAIVASARKNLLE